MNIGSLNLLDAFFPAQVGQVAAGATTTSIPTAGKTYIPSAWKGGYMYFVNGAAKGQFAAITDNTTTVFTVSGLTVAPDKGDVFVLYSRPQVDAALTDHILPDTKPLPDNIVNSQVAVPMDKQAVYRILAFITTTPLDASASYTSATFDALLYRRITGKAFADQAGTLNIQHSDDGSTWDTLTSVSVSANTPVKFDEPVYCRYVRLNYVNGDTAQTVFRLSAYLSAD